MVAILNIQDSGQAMVQNQYRIATASDRLLYTQTPLVWFVVDLLYTTNKLYKKSTINPQQIKTVFWVWAVMIKLKPDELPWLETCKHCWWQCCVRWVERPVAASHRHEVKLCTACLHVTNQQSNWTTDTLTPPACPRYWRSMSVKLLSTALRITQTDARVNLRSYFCNNHF